MCFNAISLSLYYEYWTDWTILKENRILFSLDPEKRLSFNVSKYLHFKPLTVKDTKGTSSLFICFTKYIGDIF